MDVYAIIPARYKSTRLEGKPLELINGKPMFWHVYSQSLKVKFKKVFLATDDERIQKEAEKLDVPCVMTSAEHASGSDRICEAAQLLQLPESCIIVNVQGDEPLIKPEMLNQLVLPFKQKPGVQVTTLAHKLDSVRDVERFLSPNTVKITLDINNNALYFSRSPIPFVRDAGERVNFYAHVGLYAFRHEVLKMFTSLAPTELELTEKLEQLRLLENNIQIHVVSTEHYCVGVDTKEDLEKVRALMK